MEYPTKIDFVINIPSLTYTIYKHDIGDYDDSFSGS